MEKIFLSVLNMSLTASFVIAAIMLARLPLKKAPKIISYVLWAVAGFRLVFPFTLEGIFSLLPFKSTPIPTDIATQAVPRIDSGITVVDNAVSAVLPAAIPAASANPLQIWLMVGSYIWLVGVTVMLIYSIVSIVFLKKQLRSATLVEGHLYEAGNLKTPFVIGLFSPKIYIPAGLSGEERTYIILHEQTHIRRHDHAVKLFAYFVLCLHWFNPFAWAAFLLMGADMEMSCDERVIKEMGENTKKAYSMSLISMAAGHRIIGGSPLAFGEGGMKERIKNVLNFKKPSRVIIIAAVVLVAVLTVGLAMSKSADDASVKAAVTADGKAQPITIDSYENPPYVPLGSTIKLQINEDFPDTINVTDIIVRSDGSPKYDRRLDKEVEYAVSGNAISFAVENNWVTALSSNSEDYKKGNTYRWYYVQCGWRNGDEKEYAIYVRTDAAITFEDIDPDKVSFSIFVPTVMPDGLVTANLTIDEGPPTYVKIDYRTKYGSTGLLVLNGPAGSGLAADPRKKGETIKLRGDIPGHFLDNQPQFGGPILWWEEAGSYIALSGPELNKTDLVKIADSMSSTRNILGL